MNKPEYFDKYGFRYHSDWRKISLEARRRTNHRCSFCQWKPANQTHHAAYLKSNGGLVDWEDIGTLLFPLCEDCHGIAHRKKHWIISRDFGCMANRNTDEFIDRLVLRYHQCILYFSSPNWM